MGRRDPCRPAVGNIRDDGVQTFHVDSQITAAGEHQDDAPAQVLGRNEFEREQFLADEEAILAELLPRNVAIQLFRAMLENAASEQGSRMTAMDNATRNAGDMIKKLSISYNRQRQAQITTELIEIIAGAEAL